MRRMMNSPTTLLLLSLILLLRQSIAIAETSSQKPVEKPRSQNGIGSEQDPAVAAPIVNRNSPSTFDNCDIPCLTALQKKYFNDTFGSTYQVAQIFVQPTHLAAVQDKAYMMENEVWGPVFNKTFLEATLKLQELLSNVTASYEKQHVRLGDICLRSAGSDSSPCVVLSPLQYFQNNRTRLDAVNVIDSDYSPVGYIDHLRHCIESPKNDDEDLKMPCLGDSGQVQPDMVLGGYPRGEFMKASLLVISFLLQHHINESDFRKTEAWQKEMSNFLGQYHDPILNATFTSWSFPLDHFPSGPIESQAPTTSSGVVVTASSAVIIISTAAVLLGMQRNESLL